MSIFFYIYSYNYLYESKYIFFQFTLAKNKTFEKINFVMKKLILLLAAVATLCGCASTEKVAQAQPKHRNIAVQTYTFNKFTLEETINKIKGLGLDGVECYPKQRLSDKFPGVLTNQYMTEEQKAFMKKLLKDANLKLVSFGVAYANNEKEIEDLCKFAQEFGCTRVVTEAPQKLFPIWEKVAPKYGITMAVHHHTAGNNDYWNPDYIFPIIKDYKNIKMNPDVGHSARAKIPPMYALKKYEGKIASVHIKDLEKFGVLKVTPVVLGKGVLDIKSLLKELDRQGYDGFFVIEFETKYDNNLPEVKECIDFLRKN